MKLAQLRLSMILLGIVIQSQAFLSFTPGINPIFIQAHASFKIVSHFLIGDDPHPSLMTIQAGEMFVDQKALRKLLAGWTLEGLRPEDFYVMTLDWRHGEGYSGLTLTGSRLNLMVRFR